MDIVLVGGLWLGPEVWDDVVAELARLGHRAAAVRLPGQGDGAREATLDAQRDAVVAAVDEAAVGGRPVMVVGHSAASTLAWLAADARPDRVAPVVFLGGFPKADGDTYADYFPVEDGVMAFPGWEPFAGADSADLTEEDQRRLAEAAIPVPVGVSRDTVRLGDERRYAVPAVLLCPEYSTDEARAWVTDGEVPELTRAASVDYVDVDSGHWPMVSQPVALARVLADLA